MLIQRQCNGPDAQGRDCQFIRFKQGVPNLLAPLASTVVDGQQTLTAFIPTPSLTARCPISGCGKNCIAPDCDRHWCRKHCADMGGCKLKNNRPSNTLLHTILPTPSTPAMPPAPAVFSMPATLQPVPLPPIIPLPPHDPSAVSSLPTLSQAPQSGDAHTLNAHPNPRYVSHMLPIFTEQWRREQELHEEKRQQDATQTLFAAQSKQALIIYAWSANGEPAHIEEVQSLSWPYLPLTTSVLSHVKLSPSSGIQIYCSTISSRVNISEGHVIDMQVYGTCVFLKAPSVTNYPDFDTHLHADSLNASPHIHYKLVQERRELCERYKRKMKEGVMEMTSDSDGDERPKKPVRATAVGQDAVLAGDPKVFRLLCNTNLNKNIPSRGSKE